MIHMILSLSYTSLLNSLTNQQIVNYLFNKSLSKSLPLNIKMKEKDKSLEQNDDDQDSPFNQFFKEMEKDIKQKKTKTKTITKQKKQEIHPTKKESKNIKSQQTIGVIEKKQQSLLPQTKKQSEIQNNNSERSNLPKKQNLSTTQNIRQNPTVKKSLDEDQKFKSSKYKIKDTFRVIGSRAYNQSHLTKRLSIMSWNVWNEGHNVTNSNMENRYNEIVKIITGKNPDIICLQQTEKFRQRHLRGFLQSLKGSQYYSPDPNLISFNSSIILCKYPSKFYEVKFSKGLKTKPMAVCEFKINCKDGKSRTVIAHSVHLKARSSNQETQSTRLLQLKLISKINRQYDISIAAGDYNIDDKHSQDKYVKYDFLDLQSHHKNPNQVTTLPEYKPIAERSDVRIRNFSTNFSHQDQESEESDDEMMENQYQSQDSFDGYSDSFYEDSSQQDGSFAGEHQFTEEYDHDDQSEDNSFDSSDGYQGSYDGDHYQEDNSFGSSGSDDYRGPRWRPPKPPRDFRRRIIQRPPSRQRQNRQRGFRGRPPYGNRPYQIHPPRHQGQRSRLPPAHQIPDDNPTNTWTYMYYPDKSKCRFDRILMGCTELQKKNFRRKINVTQFQRLGNYSVGIHSIQKFMAYLYDKIVRSPSDHLGVFAVLFLNF